MTHSELAQIFGYSFSNETLLEEALTHPSVSRAAAKGSTPFNYERLEFLGDSVLGLIIAELLLRRYPHEKEGALAKRSSALVKGEALARVAKKLTLGNFIRMTAGEETMGGRTNENNIENALEAVIGAMYLDGGIEPVRSFIQTHWATLLDEMQEEPPKDPKTALQEWAQGQGLAIPHYSTVKTEGPSHAPFFTVQVKVGNHSPCTGSGASKKLAEREAAEKMLEVVRGS